jgi:transposase
MRVAEIKPWLSAGKMANWVASAPDEAASKRRSAIWLTSTQKLPAHKAAEILGVSTQAVWLWVGQYNKAGPAGLERKGRGGRRWAFLTAAEEAELLKPFIRSARSYPPPNTKRIKQAVEEKLGRKVSAAYVYRLLNRYRWSDIIARSRLKTSRGGASGFLKLSRPWLANKDKK